MYCNTWRYLVLLLSTIVIEYTTIIGDHYILCYYICCILLLCTVPLWRLTRYPLAGTLGHCNSSSYPRQSLYTLMKLSQILLRTYLCRRSPDFHAVLDYLSSTHILNLQRLPVPLAQVHLQRPAKQLQQHLKTHLANRRVVPAFAEFVADKCICLLSARSDFARFVKMVRNVTYAAPRRPHTTQISLPSHARSCGSDLVLPAGHGCRFFRRSVCQSVSFLLTIS